MRAIHITSLDGPEAIELTPTGLAATAPASVVPVSLAAPAPVAPPPPTTAGGVGALVGRRMEEVERDLILETLTHCLGNRTRAAEILGISIRTLRNKLHEYRAQGAAVPVGPGQAMLPPGFYATAAGG